MFDKLLEVGSMFDFITPLLAWILDIARWPSHTFILREGDCGGAWTEADLRQLLKREHIQVWGEMIVDNRVMFTVRKRDAERVAAIMEWTKRNAPPRRAWWRKLW